MRTTVIVIFACFALWAGYWVYGQSKHTDQAVSWFSDQQAEGWLAEYDTLEVKGFPNRFDTVIENMALADPNSGWAWEAQSFQILSLSYRPNHVIFVFPPEHTLRTPDQSVLLKNTDLRGSAVFESGTNFELNRSTFEGSNITWVDEALQSSGDTSGQIGSLNLATRKTPAREYTHDIAIDMTDVALGNTFLAAFRGLDSAKTDLETVTVRATASFDGPWDKPSLSGSGPDLRNLEIDNIELEFPDMLIRAAGDLEIDRLGYPTGRLEVRAENWEALVSLAIDEGLLPRDLQSTVISGLQLLARLSGDPNNLDIGLRFSNRETYLGPIPIGDAPILWPVQRQ